MEIQFRGESVYISGICEKTIKIPSAMYPLSGSPLFLTNQNTSDFPDSPQTDVIRDIFDKLSVKIGRCYSNADSLQKALMDAGIEAKTLVGWQFVFGTVPAHHCITCIDDHIMDFNILPELLADSKFSGLPVDDVRKAMADRVLRLQQSPHSQVCTFGKLSSSTLFIGSYCSPSKGLSIYQKLARAYPKHPAMQNLDAHGATPLQRMVLNKTISQ